MERNFAKMLSGLKLRA